MRTILIPLSLARLDKQTLSRYERRAYQFIATFC
jgi:hypothetical protein